MNRMRNFCSGGVEHPRVKHKDFAGMAGRPWLMIIAREEFPAAGAEPWPPALPDARRGGDTRARGIC